LQAGFDVEPFGETTFIVRSVPAFVENAGEEKLLRDVLERLAEEKPPDEAALGRILAATLACHRAVRAGQTLGVEEMNGLLAELARTREPRVCPHGRPTFVRIGFGELERRFGRE
jgi:DNA mismatch repair protein MutL